MNQIGWQSRRRRQSNHQCGVERGDGAFRLEIAVKNSSRAGTHILFLGSRRQIDVINFVRQMRPSAAVAGGCAFRTNGLRHVLDAPQRVPD